MTPGPLVVDTDATPASTAELVTERATLGAGTGFEALSQAVLSCAPGRAEAAAPDDCEEVLFVLSGRGTLHVGGEAHGLEPETGAYLAPGDGYGLENPGPEPLELIRVRIPDPEAGQAEVGPRRTVSRLADQETEAATTDREFRIVSEPATGLRAATHFVGYIPAVRAPEHFHTYDEVIYVLDGRGVFTAGAVSEPLGPGSCIQLPARTVHCLENTGTATMRVVGVFRPAGSPANAYYPDGTPAYGDAPPIQTA